MGFESTLSEPMYLLLKQVRY